jgi:hypothetical protein
MSRAALSKRIGKYFTLGTKDKRFDSQSQDHSIVSVQIFVVGSGSMQTVIRRQRSLRVDTLSHLRLKAFNRLGVICNRYSKYEAG